MVKIYFCLKCLQCLSETCLTVNQNLIVSCQMIDEYRAHNSLLCKQDSGHTFCLHFEFPSLDKKVTNVRTIHLC